MMLTSTEWTLVTEFTQSYLLATPEPYVRLQAYFAQEFVTGLSFGTRPSDNAVALVTAARVHGLRGDDPPVCQLLRALLRIPDFAALPASQRVRDMLARVERALQGEHERLAALGDPFSTNVLTGNEVFLDRLVLREALRTLSDDPSKLVLRVTGGPATGKSYSYQLISYLSDVGEFMPALVQVDETFTAEDVVHRLGLHVAPEESPPPLGDADRNKWLGYAALWLVTRAAAQDLLWWFVIDGLNHLPATSDVHDLVHELALAILNFKRSRARLVLLGYGGNLPSELRRRHLSEEVSVLTEADLREFFTSWYAKRQAPAPGSDNGTDLRRLEADVDATVAQVIDFARTASARDGCYMRELGRAVEEVIDELAS